MHEFPEAFDLIRPVLRRGVPIHEVKEAAGRVARDSELIKALLSMLQFSEGYKPIELQKAAWILNHAFQLDDRGFLPLRRELGRALDATEDISALRELLKVLAHAVWLDIETRYQQQETLELAVEFLHVVDVPVAVHYAALQILQSRALDGEALELALEAVRALRRQLSGDSTPLERCAIQYEARFRQKLARTKSPS